MGKHNLIDSHITTAISLALSGIEGGSSDSETESTKTVYTATVPFLNANELYMRTEIALSRNMESWLTLYDLFVTG